MPTPKRQLPSSLVSRFRKASKILGRNSYFRLGKLKNADERRHEHEKHIIHTKPHLTDTPLGRVRSVDVSRTHPEVGKVIIKRHHVGRVVKKVTRNGIHTETKHNAAELIRVLKRKVQNYNRKFKSKHVILTNLEAYAVGNELILMKKENPITLEELIKGKKSIPRFKPKFASKERRTKYFLELERHLFINTGITPSNFLVLGVKKGKLIIAPAIDSE
ncbi:MAG TPA: hypothetical protein PKK60_00220 [archaeon]|mgnify:CR=1 FL=1|nr:hypothetical protein [archaeon]